MIFEHAGRLMPSAGNREWALSQVRPVTLLVASGIVLASALLIVTGLIAGYLREQALRSSATGITRLDAAFAEAGRRSLRTVDAVLGGIADRLNQTGTATAEDVDRAMAHLELPALLGQQIEFTSQIGAIALIDASGSVINRAGEWPGAEGNVAERDFFTVLRADPDLVSFIGAPLLTANGGQVIPVARKLRGIGDVFAGVAVATIPIGEFETFYRTVPLDVDGVVSLLRRDGLVLAQYPRQPNAVGKIVASDQVLAALAAGTSGLIEEHSADTNQWRVEAVGDVIGYPVFVLLSRSGNRALTGWSHQAIVFAAFDLLGLIAIGVMVFLIARQFRAHSALQAVRAEKIEVEHARLVAEAELLKKERLSVLGQLTATVAHELRNPLSAIRNTLFTLREVSSGAGLSLERPIARIQRSIGRCDRIAGDLIEYTRARELSRVSVVFDEWLHQVLVDHPLPSNVTLVERLQADEATVRVDTDRLRRVVINLLDNAAQAIGEMPPTPAPQRIVVRSALCDDGVELTVTDTGPGIPREHMPRIFEPMFRTKSFGTGLGLATARQIVGQHAGNISVDSEVGRGTCVTVRLPLEPPMKAAA
jgi:signal transduction histidine kinase